MRISRRAMLRGGAALAALAVHPGAFAQGSWTPSRDVEFVVPSGVGGGADLLARVIHKVITEEKLVPVSIAVVNRPGGGGGVGIGYVTASRAADPHTLVLINSTYQITPILQPKVRTLSEIKPLIGVMLDDFLFFVPKDAPWKTLAEFVRDAKSKPPKTYALSTGGTTDLMGITVLSRAAGIELNAVNFNSGGEALTALLGGHVHASIGNPLEFMGHVKSGAVRAIGVFRDARFPQFADVATVKEQGIDAPNFQMWRGVAVPKDAPAPAIAYWTGVMEKVAASPQFKTYLADNVASETSVTGEAFDKFLADQEKLYRTLLDK